MDHREKGGYSQYKTVFFSRNGDSSDHEVVMYVGLTSHRQYAGPAPLEDIALTIFKSVGPSGPNVDYLMNLADAVREMGQSDDHVFQLEQIVRGLSRSEHSS